MIWLTLILFAVSFFLSVLLTPKPNVEDARAGTLDDLGFPRADEGTPVALIFGRQRLKGPHVLWYGDFVSRAKKKKVKTGLFSSKKVTTGYYYYVGLHLGVGIGPLVRLRKVWLGKHLLWSGTASGDGSQLTINKPGLFGGADKGGGFVGVIRFYSGGSTQTENAYLQTQLGTVPKYNDVAHMVFERPYIGTQPSLRVANIEVERYPNNLGLATAVQVIGDDLNPAEILYTVLTENWGGLNIDPFDIDTASFLSVASTLADEENGMSILVTRAADGKKVIEEVLRQIDGVLYQDPVTGKMVLKLIRNDYDEATLPLFDESRVAKITNFSRTAWSDTINQVRVTFTDRRREYERGSAFIQDMANISVQGQVRSTTIGFPGVTEPALANRLGARELSQLGVPLVRATLHLIRTDAVDLRPGSVFRLSWDDYDIDSIVMRVQKFDMGELTDGRVAVDVIQDAFADASPIYADPASTSWAEIDREASDILLFSVFESPKWFVDQCDDTEGADSPVTTNLWALARPPLYGERFDMITSNDNFVGEVTTEVNNVEFPNSGLLVEAVYQQMGQPSGELTKIVIGSMHPFDFEPTDATEFNIRTHGFNLILINGEFMAFENVTDNGDGTWDLEDVHRAMFDSTIEDHEIGDAVYFVDSVDWMSYNQRDYPGTYSYKLLCSTDQDSQDEADVTASSIVYDRRYVRPYAPDYITVEGIRAPFQIIGVTDIDVTFRARNRADTSLAFYDDAADTPEAGSSYNVVVKLDGDAIANNIGAAGPTINVTGLDGAGWMRVEIDTVVSSIESYLPDAIEFFYANYASLSSDLVLNGGFTGSLANWSTVSGTMAISETSSYHPLYPQGGTSSYVRATEDGSEIRQDIVTTSYQGQAGIFRVFRGSRVAGAETSVIIEQWDDFGGDTLLDSITIPAASVDPGKWEVIDVAIPIRSDCDYLRIRLQADDGGSFEQCSFQVNTVTRTTSMTTYDNITGLTVEGAWGLRQLDSGYSGALVRIRDTYDDTEQDVGQDIDGNLEAFYTRGEARVTTLYDQSGNSADLVQTTDADQPRLRHQLSETGRPFIEFEDRTGSNMRLADATSSTSRPYMVTRPNQILAMGPRASSAEDGWYATVYDDPGSGSDYRCGLIAQDSPNQFQLSVNTTKYTISNDPEVANYVTILDYQNGAAYQNAYGTTAATWTAADITYPNSTYLSIGLSPGNNNEINSEFHELCIYSGNISSADRNTMMNQVADYWWNESVPS